MLNFCVSGALYRPLTRRKKSTQSETPKETYDLELNELTANANTDESSRQDHENVLSKTLNEDQANCFTESKSMNYMHKPSEKKENVFKRACRACSSNFDLPLFKHVPFVAYAFLNCTVLMMNTINNSFLASLADDKGFTVTQITFTIMVTNLTGVPVRAVTGLIMDRRWLRELRVTIIGWMVFVVGVLTFSLPLVPGVAGTIVLWCVYEGVIGACECQQATFVADIVGEGRLTSAMGLLRLFAGFSALIGPILGGMYVCTKTKTINASYLNISQKHSTQ